MEGGGRMTEYCVYKGDTFITAGTAEEVAEHMGWLVKTVKWYTMPTYQRRIAKRKNARNYITVEKLEEEEE